MDVRCSIDAESSRSEEARWRSSMMLRGFREFPRVEALQLDFKHWGELLSAARAVPWAETVRSHV